MKTFTALLVLCEGKPPVIGGFPTQRPVTWSFYVFYICTWTNGWANNRDASDLRRHGTHYDITVMFDSPAYQEYTTVMRKPPSDIFRCHSNAKLIRSWRKLSNISRYYSFIFVSNDEFLGCRKSWRGITRVLIAENSCTSTRTDSYADKSNSSEI